jgi:hypothetical protein
MREDPMLCGDGFTFGTAVYGECAALPGCEKACDCDGAALVRVFSVLTSGARGDDAERLLEKAPAPAAAPARM